jgi:pimeloyl-ACP methyl ester carboxylesterase
MPIVTLSSGELHYIEYGRGVPLVLLHANPGDSRDFDAIMPALAQHYRVLALDWPGYGASAMPPAGTVMNARILYDAFCEFLAALALPPALIIGNSLGGNVAARLAIESRAKVRGLVLVSPGGFTPHNFITQAFCQLQGSRFALPPRMFARWYLKHRTPTVRAMLERAATSQATAPSLAVNRSVWRGFIEAEHDLRQRATLIATPTLLVFGARDPVISARQDGRLAASLIRGAKLVVMPAGHAPFAEVPDQFLAEVLPFLQRCAGEGETHEG